MSKECQRSITGSEEIKSYRIDAEPGDGSHYEYIVTIDFKETEVFFIGTGGDFKYPKYMSFSTIKRLQNLTPKQLGKASYYDSGVNIYTVKECVTAVVEILKMEKNKC